MFVKAATLGVFWQTCVSWSPAGGLDGAAKSQRMRQHNTRRSGGDDEGCEAQLKKRTLTQKQEWGQFGEPQSVETSHHFMLRAPSHGKSSPLLADCCLNIQQKRLLFCIVSFDCFGFGYATLMYGPVRLLPGLSVNITGPRWLFVRVANGGANCFDLWFLKGQTSDKKYKLGLMFLWQKNRKTFILYFLESLPMFGHSALEWSEGRVQCLVSALHN